MKVTGKKAEEYALQSYPGGGGQETMVCFASTPVCLTWCREAVLLGADALVA